MFFIGLFKIWPLAQFPVDHLLHPVMHNLVLKLDKIWIQFCWSFLSNAKFLLSIKYLYNSRFFSELCCLKIQQNLLFHDNCLIKCMTCTLMLWHHRTSSIFYLYIWSCSNMHIINVSSQSLSIYSAVCKFCAAFKKNNEIAIDLEIY